jgi:hypothetical protein
VAPQGVESYGVGLGSGASYTTTHTQVFKLSNGIKNVSQGLSTTKNSLYQAITPPSILRKGY